MTPMSAFNEYQQDYMRDLARLPLVAKCACQWYRFGTCPNCPAASGGYDRCDAPYEPWPSIRCTRKASHDGEHGGFRRVGCGGESMTWPRLILPSTDAGETP